MVVKSANKPSSQNQEDEGEDSSRTGSKKTSLAPDTAGLGSAGGAPRKEKDHMPALLFPTPRGVKERIPNGQMLFHEASMPRLTTVIAAAQIGGIVGRNAAGSKSGVESVGLGGRSCTSLRMGDFGGSMALGSRPLG